MSLILDDREKRFYKVKQIINEYNTAIVLKANMPGDEKTFKEVYLLLAFFNKKVLNKLKKTKSEFYNSHDGPYYIYYDFKESVSKLKKSFIDLEDNHPLGRFIDIDVYSKTKTHTRKESNLPQRKCLLCDKEAWVCMKNMNHTVAELKTHIIKTSNDYFKDDLKEIIVQAFLTELNVHPKFGLVTPFSNGSHLDMNYKIMVDSLSVILPYLLDIYTTGYTTINIKKGFDKIREIGINAEKAMFKSTKGANTYKGAIFLIGVMLYALGYYHQNQNLSYQEIIKSISKNILAELEGMANTYGIYAYQQFGMYTIRHEVYYGIPSVYEATSYLENFNEINNESLTMTLIHIIKGKKDTVALKRAKTMEDYLKWVDKISSITKFNQRQVEEISDECINNNMSFGGSADILIAVMLMYFINKKGYLK